MPTLPYFEVYGVAKDGSEHLVHVPEESVPRSIKAAIEVAKEIGTPGLYRIRKVVKEVEIVSVPTKMRAVTRGGSRRTKK